MKSKSTLIRKLVIGSVLVGMLIAAFSAGALFFSRDSVSADMAVPPPPPAPAVETTAVEAPAVEAPAVPPQAAPVTNEMALSASAAEAIALASFPGTAVAYTERAVNEGRPAWDVLLSNGTAVYVHAETGEIIEIEANRSQESAKESSPSADSSATSASPPPNGRVNAAAAEAIALERYPGTTVIERKPGFAYGTLVWDIELSNGVYIEISQANGDIVEIYGGGESWENPNYSR
ncbi:MAG: PepSY domain-containing protein [Chloroflexota bacterium]